jgi:hypothetical protein
MVRVNWKVSQEWILVAAAVAAANCVLPASATDLQVAPVHKAVSLTPPKKTLPRPHAVEIAYIQPTSRSDLLPERYFPLILGVAY